MQLFVGQTSLRGDFRRYAREFNYVELLAEPQVLPNVKKVRTFASETKGKVQFGVVVSPRIWEGGGDELGAYFKKVAAACSPTWIVVRTPSSVRPGPTSERELAKKIDELRPLAAGAHLGWEPRGLWEPGMIARVAQQLGVVPVWDGLSLPNASLGEGPAYVRFADLGVGARVNEGRLERMAVKAEQCESLHVVVEGRGASRTRQILQALFEDPFASVDEDSIAPDSDDAGHGESDVEDTDFEDEGDLNTNDTEA